METEYEKRITTLEEKTKHLEKTNEAIFECVNKTIPEQIRRLENNHIGSLSTKICDIKKVLKDVPKNSWKEGKDSLQRW